MQIKITRPLEQLQAEALARVDTLAGAVRKRYITSAPGQEATYTAKLADAKAYKAAGNPADAAPFVWIKSEAEATGATPAATADMIIATAEQWTAIGSAIEAARQAAKQTIKNAGNAGQIRTAEQNFKTAIEPYD